MGDFEKKFSRQCRRGDDKGALFSLQRLLKSEMDFPKDQMLNVLWMYRMPKSAAKLIQEMGVSPEAVNEMMQRGDSGNKERSG